MKKTTTLFFAFISVIALSQNSFEGTFNSFITPELIFGTTAESNTDFPESSSTIGLFLHLGKFQQNNPQEWAYRLGYPKTSIALGVVDYGNTDALGQAFTLLPNAEFNILGRTQRRFTMNIGLGASYFTKQFDTASNPLNQAVSTNFTWTFKLFFHYKMFESKTIQWRLGGGYLHHSNGHTRLPNNGFNSLVGSVSAIIGTNEQVVSEQRSPNNFEKSEAYYFSPRIGIGSNVLSLIYNDKKEVYSIAFSAGKQFNRAFKVGVGFSYRYYEHYYDYIIQNESLVQDGREFEDFKEHPRWSASNVTLFVEGELLLNHIGVSFQIGANLHKPAYDIDWRINQGWDNTPREIPESWVLGKYNSKYKLKKYIPTRLGLRYYLFGNETYPTHNVYAGASINANLGQADFTEFSVGYVYLFREK